MTERPEEQPKPKFSLRVSIILVGILIVVEGIIVYIILSNLFEEITNLVAVVIEISAALFISLTVLLYDRHEQARVRNVLNRINEISESVKDVLEKQNNIITELAERGKKRKHYRFLRIKSDLERLKDDYRTAKMAFEDYHKEMTQQNLERVIEWFEWGKANFAGNRDGIIADLQSVSDYVDNERLIDKFPIYLDNIGKAFYSYSNQNHPYFRSGELYRIRADIDRSLSAIDALIRELEADDKLSETGT